jgi:uncharacterized membrane protein HdeD (DUF308 family)
MELQDLTYRMGPVGSIVLAVLMVILGVLVIYQPLLLPWLVGIALILGGTAFVVGILAAGSRRTV